MKRIFVLIFFLVMAMSASIQRPVYGDKTGPVSLIQLIATPEKYDGQLIEVIGFMHLAFENDELFVNKSDFENRISKNGVWIEQNKNLIAHSTEVNDRYAIVVGTFSAGNRGHMGMASGAITKITYAGPWPNQGGVQRWPQ